MLSCAVHGAAAAGTIDLEQHAARTAVVFDAVDLETLRQLALDGPHWGAQHLAAPLVFTPDYLRASLDTFPLELLEIQQQHRMLFGDDHFAPLEFAPADVRLQCERELKVLLMAVQQGVLTSSGREENLQRLSEDLIERLVRTLRGIAWQHGVHEGRPAREVVAEVERLLATRLPGVAAAVQGLGGSPWQHYTNLYADVQRLGHYVNEC